jgi:drug/metabolite transporter (DMT)-like permease
VAYRFVAAARSLRLVRGQPRKPAFRSPDASSFALLGMLQFALNYVFVYLAEQYLTSGLVAVVFVLMVFWNLLGAHFLFAGRSPRRACSSAPRAGCSGWRWCSGRRSRKSARHGAGQGS